MATVAELAAVFQELSAAYPGAEVRRNEVGNLLFTLPGSEQPTGYIDLLEPEWHLFQ